MPYRSLRPVKRWWYFECESCRLSWNYLEYKAPTFRCQSCEGILLGRKPRTYDNRKRHKNAVERARKRRKKEEKR